ncbi:MAG TPA: ATP-dependent DNA ligase [Candidatus Solibacter sp.]|nr:ATP-dependent DNA ligase [Candidatus Solibacter sp.]
MLPMQALAATCEAVAATTKKKEKVRLVAEYFCSRPVAEAALAAIFLSGRAFPAWEERTLQIGGTLLWRAVAEVSGKGEVALTAAYRRHGDLGSAAQDVLSKDVLGKDVLSKDKAHRSAGLSVSDVAAVFEELAKKSTTAHKLATLEDLLRRATPLEAKYIVKVIGGDLRIGLRESLVEEAIAKAFDETPAEVQRADMMLGDIGETLRLAAEHKLRQARMRLFHPIGFMLASPAQDAREAFEYFTRAAVEDKYDGIRAQAHCGGKNNPRVRIFSRTLDEISESFPELPGSLLAFPEPVILDGEILAWEPEEGRALPFSALQKRLGRKKVSSEMVREIPAVYMVFDILHVGGDLMIEKPLEERRKVLDQVFASIPEGSFNVEHELAARNPQGQLVFEPAISSPSGPPRVILAPMLMASSPEHLEELFEAARNRGNEGLMVKDLNSPYTPGRRGKSWLKLKRELATLDVVVTAVEWGHGKRVNVLSDYTFAVRDGDRLLNVGKAYSGLTDKEIAEMTQWFLEHTLEDQGFARKVEPKIVLEVAFNNLMKSDRHASGFALRFPRILRIRTDKPVEEIDTLDTVREIYEKQQLRASESDDRIIG